MPHRSRTLIGIDASVRDLSCWSRIGQIDDLLRTSLWEAEGVLVLNRLAEAMLGSIAKRVHVLPCGMDKARFPGPIPARSDREKANLLLASLPDEAIIRVLCRDRCVPDALKIAERF